MIRNTTRNQKLGWILFILYLVALSYVLFFSDFFGRVDRKQTDYSYNLMLFKEIKRFYTYREILGMKAFLINIVGNIVAFIPFGFFLPIISRRANHWHNTLLLTVTLTLGVEVIQLVSKVGSFDVDDILLNTLGGIMGYMICRIVQRIRRRVHAKV